MMPSETVKDRDTAQSLIEEHKDHLLEDAERAQGYLDLPDTWEVDKGVQMAPWTSNGWTTEAFFLHAEDKVGGGFLLLIYTISEEKYHGNGVVNGEEFRLDPQQRLKEVASQANQYFD